MPDIVFFPHTLVSFYFISCHSFFLDLFSIFVLHPRLSFLLVLFSFRFPLFFSHTLSFCLMICLLFVFLFSFIFRLIYLLFLSLLLLFHSFLLLFFPFPSPSYILSFTFSLPFPSFILSSPPPPQLLLTSPLTSFHLLLPSLLPLLTRSPSFHSLSPPPLPRSPSFSFFLTSSSSASRSHLSHLATSPSHFSPSRVTFPLLVPRSQYHSRFGD